MAAKGMFTEIGDQLQQLTDSIAIVRSYCERQRPGRSLVRLVEEIHERVRLDEKMIRNRFELPPATRQPDPLDGAGHVDGRPVQAEDVILRLRSSQELTRSLEEYFRFFNLKHIAKSFHKLRLDLYGLERNLAKVLLPGRAAAAAEPVPEPAVGEPSRIRAALGKCPLYFILDESLCQYRDPLRVGYDAIVGGVRIMQLRFKRLATRELLELARKLRGLCAEQDCLLIINDRLDIAVLSGADGIHVGASDISINDIRQLSPDLLVGVTARKPQDAMAAQETGADYVGSGSVFGSKTKPGLPVIGTRGLRTITQAVDIPVVAIGGVTLENCQRVMAAGASGFVSIKPFTSRRSVKNLVAEFRRHSAATTSQAGS